MLSTWNLENTKKTEYTESFIRMPKFHWGSKFLSKRGFWPLTNFYIILLWLPKRALIFFRMKMRKSDFCNILCDEVLWMQYNILQSHKLKNNDLNHVNNVIFTYVSFWPILKYHMVFKKWFKQHCASLKEKKPLCK